MSHYFLLPLLFYFSVDTNTRVFTVIIAAREDFLFFFFFLGKIFLSLNVMGCLRRLKREGTELRSLFEHSDSFVNCKQVYGLSMASEYFPSISHR